MTSAAVDVVGFLPAPATRANRGSSDLLEGQLFAYGVGSGIAVAEVHRLQIACVLQGGHRNSAVTAVKWCPDCHSRDLKSYTHLRLASGDADGGVAVWSVMSVAVSARLEDSFNVREHLRERRGGGGTEREGGGGIQGLAWVCSQPCLLAVLIAPATLLLWDTKGGAVVWKRELSASDTFTSLEVDPLDRRRLCLCSAQGQLAVVLLTQPEVDRVEVKQFRVSLTDPSATDVAIPSSSSPNNISTSGAGSGGGASAAVTAAGSSPTFQAMFSVSRDLLFVLLPKDLLVFDLELGVPASMTRMSPARGAAPFQQLLGVFGRGVSHGIGDEGGADCVYVAHTDGGLSIWGRCAGELQYKLSCSSRLTPPMVRGSLNPVVLLAARAMVWKQDLAVDELQARPSLVKLENLTRNLQAALLPERIGDTHAKEREEALAGRTSHTGAKSKGADAAKANTFSSVSDKSLLIMGVTSDGRLWQWDSPLPQFADRSYITSTSDTPIVSITGTLHAGGPPLSSAAPPLLVGLLHTLPHAVTTFCMYPRPILVARHPPAPVALGTSAADLSPEKGGVAAVEGGEVADASVGAAEVALLGAAVTAGGGLEVFTVHRGLVSPLSIEVAASLCVHGEAVRGVRWLGTSPRIASFSSERTPHGWRNSLALTDVRSRRSVAFREGVALEVAPLLGIRASPSGAYVLLLLKGAPAELWAVDGDRRPVRLRLLDLPFTAVEWVLPQDSPSMRCAPSSPEDWATWQGSPLDPQCQYPSGTMFGRASRGPSSPDGVSASGGNALPHEQQEQGVRVGDSNRGGVGAAAVLAGGGGGGGGVGPPPAPSSDARFASNLSQATSTGLASATSAGFGKALDSFSATMSGLSILVGATPGGGPPSSAAMGGTFGGASGARAPLGSATASGVNTPMAGVPGPFDSMPEELLVFTLGDGRAGVLAVHGRRVADMRPKRPASGPLQPLEVAATAIVAWGRLVVMGDAEGRLILWDTSTGRASSLNTAYGMVRRLQISAPPHPQLYTPPDGASAILARISVLFAAGQFGVYELDTSLKLRVGHASANACLSAGKAMDLAWLPLPWEAGSGSVLAAVTEEGAVSLLDVAQASDRRPHSYHRMAALKLVLGDVLQPPPQGAVLSAPLPHGSSLLMHRSWALLIRLLIQLGVSAETLLYLGSASAGGPEDEDVRSELLALIPKGARSVLLCLMADDAASHPAASAKPQQPFFSITPPHSPPPQSRPTIASRSSSQLATGAHFGGTTSSSRSDPDLPAQAVSSTQDSSSQGGTQKFMRSMMRDAFNLVKAPTTVFGHSGNSPSEHSDGRSFSPPTGGGAGSGWRSAEGSQRAGLLGGGRQPHSKITSFDGSLLHLLQALSKMRTQGQLLHPAEWRSYTRALGSGSVAERMAVAAKISGDQAEAGFWTCLPSTLAAVKVTKEQLHRKRQGESSLHIPLTRPSPGHPTSITSPATHSSHTSASSSSFSTGAGPGGGARTLPHSMSLPHGHGGTGIGDGGPSGGVMLKLVPTGPAVQLWDEDLTLAEAQERTIWHEAMSRSVFAGEALQERRMLEYVVLGDFQTAVAFLLASSPERSARYYRDALCTMALAAAASARESGANRPAGGALLLAQASKVISAHASSVGDALLGVPLHCAAGLFAEAVGVLQEVGMWRHAANLTAHALRGVERAVALQRWAEHVLEFEGSVWRAAGILTAGGCLRGALQVLQQAGLPDCAAAYMDACQQAGLLISVQTRDPGTIVSASDHRTSTGADMSNIFSGLGSSNQRTSREGRQPQSSDGIQTEGSTDVDLNSVFGGRDVSHTHLELYDVLAAVTTPHRVAHNVHNGSAMGPDGEVAAVHAQFELYVCDLLSQL